VVQSSNQGEAASASGEAKSNATAESGLSAGLEWLLAYASGLLIANLYYAQPLAGPIGESLGMAASSVGLLFSLPVADLGLSPPRIGSLLE
jgi:hypothetical protein